LVYISFEVGYGAKAPPPYYIEHLTNWLRILFAELLLNMLGLWSIKFSFLALFRKLSKDVRRERILWWVITALTVISLAISIGVSYFPCIFATSEFEESKLQLLVGETLLNLI
jgi:putative Mn2+ efflux pump MntP